MEPFLPPVPSLPPCLGSVLYQREGRPQTELSPKAKLDPKVTLIRSLMVPRGSPFIPVIYS